MTGEPDLIEQAELAEWERLQRLAKGEPAAVGGYRRKRLRAFVLDGLRRGIECERRTGGADGSKP